jgi:cytochrome c556
MFRQIAILATVASCALTSGAIADEQADPNVNARQSYMGLLAYNLGVIGGMAQNRMPYDADMAATAAANLHALAMVDTSRMWAEGTDNFSMEDTRALPAIWDNSDDFSARFTAMQSATEAMMAVAGTDLASLQGAMGGLGGACGGCHQNFRQPQ